MSRARMTILLWLSRWTSDLANAGMRRTDVPSVTNIDREPEVSSASCALEIGPERSDFRLCRPDAGKGLLNTVAR
ncbi:hypothetical protein AN948_01755 [Rhodococcus sp. ADH]|nr:hypothetical protein AN948_01755 [Rhodococcus sp. ADH]KZF16513.1 hypothetical protein A2J01_26895 [Rhodococcus sp. EPR-134]